MAWCVASWRGQPQRLVFLDARGQLLEFRDHVIPAAVNQGDFRDMLTPADDLRVPWRIRTRSMIWGDLESPKDLDGVELEFNKSDARVDVDVVLDDKSGAALCR
jgi:hypothetical protein